MDDLGCVMNEVLDVAAEWYDLGLQLNIRTSELKCIRQQFNTPKDQLREMLDVWLTSGDDPSWKALTNAIRSRSVEKSQLAGVLETKYCQVKETGMDTHTYTSDTVISKQKVYISESACEIYIQQYSERLVFFQVPPLHLYLPSLANPSLKRHQSLRKLLHTTFPH